MCEGAHFYGVRHTPTARRAVPQCCPILGVPFYFCVHPLTPNYQILCGRACFQGVSPIPMRAGPQRSPIFGVPLLYVYTLCRRTTKFDTITHMGSGLVFRKSITAQSPKGMSSSAPQFSRFSIYDYTLKKNGQIRRGDTLGGACF